MRSLKLACCALFIYWAIIISVILDGVVIKSNIVGYISKNILGFNIVKYLFNVIFYVPNMLNHIINGYIFSPGNDSFVTLIPYFLLASTWIFILFFFSNNVIKFILSTKNSIEKKIKKK